MGLLLAPDVTKLSRPTMIEPNVELISTEQRQNSILVRVIGAWRVATLETILELTPPSSSPPAQNVIVNCKELSELDTAGSLYLLKLLRPLGDKLSWQDLTPRHRALLELVIQRSETDPKRFKPTKLGLVGKIGESTLNMLNGAYNLLSFLGETLIEFYYSLLAPRTLRIREIFVQLEHVCINALPIAALVTFLIGIVIAYLFAGQMERYGANIFIVDAVSIGMCREMSPILVAIILAGRSGSAFTAQIGTMKLNQELDAMSTLGLTPLRVLVLPRLIALVLAMPLLTFIGDMMGILGGMMTADLRLGITSATFLERMQAVLLTRHVWVGLIKAPVFAAFIAIIGCRMGLDVELNARSVGLNTTSTVVQSIVSVILLNAAFAILFVELKY